MKSSIIFYCPYFGTIEKTQFSLWLKSCKVNQDISFMIFTDDAEALKVELPGNVQIVTMTWEQFQTLVQSKFDYPISLETAYKICDYRPAFGYIFSDYVNGYDFWGYTDSGDTLYGNIEKFLTDDILSQYNKIHIYGHMSLYRNTVENNMCFKIMPQSGLSAQEVFSLPENLCFDDMFQKASINRIYQENGFPLLEQVLNLVVDLQPDTFRFRICEDKAEWIPRVFEWDNGVLNEVTVRDGTLQYREIGYVHFQKRKMKNEITQDADHFYMIPNAFIPADEPLTVENVMAWSRDRLYLDPLKGRVKRIFNYAKQPDVFIRKIKDKIT